MKIRPFGSSPVPLLIPVTSEGQKPMGPIRLDELDRYMGGVKDKGLSFVDFLTQAGSAAGGFLKEAGSAIAKRVGSKLADPVKDGLLQVAFRWGPAGILAGATVGIVAGPAIGLAFAGGMAATGFLSGMGLHMYAKSAEHFNNGMADRFSRRS